MKYHVAVIGAGRAGSAVARALQESGCHLTAVVSRTRSSAEKLGRELAVDVRTNLLEDVPRNTTLIVIAVPNSMIAEPVKSLARLNLNWKRVVAFHLSGSTTRRPLAPLARKGATIMALHPAFPFTSRSVSAERLHGAGWGVDCDDHAWPVARRIVRSMQGEPVRVPSSGRMRYHVACALVSNYGVALVESAVDLARRQGIPRNDAEELLLRLLIVTIDDIITSRGKPMQSRLTGPLSRGDAAAVGAHLASISSDPVLQNLYRALGKETIQLLTKSHPANGVIFKNVKKLLQ